MDVVKELNCQYVEEHDLVSSYLAGRLSEDEAAAFEKHYFECERCWAEVKAGEEIRAALKGGTAAVATPPSPLNVRRGPWTNWKLLAVAAAVGIAAAGAVLVLRERGASGIDALARAAGTRRTTEARLTGAFVYGQVEPITRGAEGESNVPIKLRRVALEAQEKAQENPSAKHLHAAGVAHLLVDDWDEAVATLEKASKVAPKDARILTDLAAAYHTRALRRGRAADLPPAYEAIRQAVDLDPRLAPAQYNLALILDSLGQKEEALKAWQAYLKLDPRSGWSDEARARKKALSAPPQSELWKRERGHLDAAAETGNDRELESLVGRFPQQTRQYVEDDLLTEWASASSDEVADRSLRKARAIAQALLRTNGEGLVADAVAIIEEQRPADSAETTKRLRSGHRLFGEARMFYNAANIDGALDRFRMAEERFLQTASPFLHLARDGQASCHLYGMRASEALPLLAQIEIQTRKTATRYRALLGHAIWLRGMTEAIGGRPYESLHSYQQALTVFEQLNETENIAGLHGLLAGSFLALGEPEKAWIHRIATLRLLDSGSATARLDNALGDTARVSLDEGYTRLALLADDAEIRVAEARGIPLVLAYSRLWRSQVAKRLGRLSGATEELSRAREECERITDPGSRNRTRAEIELASIQIETRATPVRAIASADRAVAFMRDIQQHGYLPELLLIRGRLHRAQGNSDLAQHDFLEGIRQLEISREDIAREDLRISYFETARSLFDEAIGLGVAAGDASTTFQLADRAHARALLDSVSRALQPRSEILLPELQNRLAGNEALVEFWISNPNCIAWIIRHDRIGMVALPGGNPNIAKQVDTALQALAGPANTSQTDSLLGDLYDQLFRPIEPYLEGITSISIVPDGPLHAIPFAALRDRQRSQYAVERFATSIVPSATFFLRVAKRPAFRIPLGLLAVANPTFDQSRFPRLPRLSGSEAEVDTIAIQFPSTRILRGPEATRSAFLRLAPNYEIIHFAGHAVINRSEPSLSALVFAPDSTTREDSGIVYAHEISSIDLSHASLVFVSACDTATGPIRSSEGMLGLARAFLAAGVPDVLATHWRVDDSAVARLVSLFYAGLAEGRDPSVALRSAQLSCIAAVKVPGQSPFGWASFELRRA